MTKKNKVRKSVEQLSRSVVLDMLCVLENGKQCAVEVQKSNDDNHEKRVRYNTSCITANITEPGFKFANVPDVISIYITRFDIFKGKKSIYNVERVVQQTGEIRDNGLREIYVNTKIEDGTDISELMKIFKTHSAYDFDKFPKTSERKKHFLENKGGKYEMCDIVEKYAQEVAQKSAKEMARKLFENGVSYEMVRNSTDLLTDRQLKYIYKKAIKGKYN